MSPAMRDYQAKASEITDVDDFDTDTVAKAQFTTAHFAENAEELVVFLQMLGIYPGQEISDNPRLFADVHPGTEARRPLIERVAAHTAPILSPRRVGDPKG